MALAYITGILPIKKIQDESALNNFEEFTMINSTPITQYYGFTEEEVKELCKQYDMDFETIKAWYNGYLIDGIHMYNPNSVSMSMRKHQLDSYWKNTSSFASINTLLIHLGYLGYDAERKKAFIPNYEVATATGFYWLESIMTQKLRVRSIIHVLLKNGKNKNNALPY